MSDEIKKVTECNQLEVGKVYKPPNELQQRWLYLTSINGRDIWLDLVEQESKFSWSNCYQWVLAEDQSHDIEIHITPNKREPKPGEVWEDGQYRKLVTAKTKDGIIYTINLTIKRTDCTPHCTPLNYSYWPPSEYKDWKLSPDQSHNIILPGMQK